MRGALVNLLLLVCQLAIAQIAPPDFLEVPPLRSVDPDRLGQVLADIESRMPAGHIYAAPDDVVNWAHETTHGINSRLRNAHAPQGNAFYCLEGRAVLLRTQPRTSLSRVAQLVPADARGLGYQLYLVQQRGYWDGTPTYVLDEATAYVNGACTAIEVGSRGSPGRSLAHDVAKCAEFNHYVAALWIAVEQDDPQYADRDQLARIIAYHHARVDWVLTRAREVGLLDERALAMQALFNRRYRPWLE